MAPVQAVAAVVRLPPAALRPVAPMPRVAQQSVLRPVVAQQGVQRLVVPQPAYPRLGVPQPAFAFRPAMPMAVRAPILNFRMQSPEVEWREVSALRGKILLPSLIFLP